VINLLSSIIILHNTLNISAQVNTMPSPSQLAIATSAVNRLLKEEVTYQKELASQEQRLKKLEDSPPDDDENREFTLEQQVRRLSVSKTYHL
jgi:tubulin-specific chaperone A